MRGFKHFMLSLVIMFAYKKDLSLEEDGFTYRILCFITYNMISCSNPATTSKWSPYSARKQLVMMMTFASWPTTLMRSWSRGACYWRVLPEDSCAHMFMHKHVISVLVMDMAIIFSLVMSCPQVHAWNFERGF